MKKKFLISSLLLTSAIAVVGVSQFNNSHSISNVNSSLNAATTLAATNVVSGLTNLADTSDTSSKQVTIPKGYYQQNSFKNLSNNNGPILLFDNARTFGATDWYGNPSWYVTLNSASGQNDGYYSASWFSTSSASAIDFSKAGTKVVDWAYNHKTDNLYVLTDTSYLIIISSTDGTIVSTSEVGNSVNKIQIVDFNDSVYLWNSKTTNPTIYTVEPQTGKVNTTTITSTDLASSYLIGIIPLDVNYSIAVTSTTDLSTAQTTATLTLKFVNDSLVSYTGAPTQTISITTSTSSDDIFIQGFKRSGDYVIFVNNNIYSVILNKSAMGSSSFTDLLNSSSNPSLSSFTLPIGGKINSAFIDTNNQIYFKTTESLNISYISVSNVFTNIAITTGTGKAFTSEDAAKSSQVFAVPISTQEDVVSQSYIGYVLSPTDFTGTGFQNGTLMGSRYTSTTNSPSFTIQNVNTSTAVPSSVSTSNLVSQNTGVSGLALETNSATLIANDYTGQLFVRVPYTITGAWYGSGSSSVVSRGYLIGKWQYKDVKSVTTWVSDTAFSSLFGTYEPNQLDVETLKAQATSIINLPQSILALTNNQLDINFIIESRDDTTGKVTLNATIQYVNAYGSSISYAMSSNHTYTVKKAATNYAFMFAGETSADVDKVDKTSTSFQDLYDSAQTAVSDPNQTEFLSIDVTGLDATYSVYANTLPSLWQISGIQKFIVTNDKYPNNPVITVLASDNTLGTIIILVQYNNLANTTPSKFAIKYTGITNYTNSKVNFLGNALNPQPTTTDGSLVYPGQTVYDITSVTGFSDYSKKLTSDITVSELSGLYSSSLMSYMGFTPEVTFVQGKEADSPEGYSSLDQEYGSFLLKLDFTQSESSVLVNSKNEKVLFPSSLYNQMGLSDGVIYIRYGGLLPIGSTYNISLNTTGSNYKSLIANNNVDATIPGSDLLSILTINGYEPDEVSIVHSSWNGENLVFIVQAQSKTYESVNETKTFTVSWSSKFASVRNMSLAVAVITSVVGITLVSLGVSIYVIRRNKIRKLLK